MPRHDDDEQDIIALATRVGNLASQVERLADGEEARDQEIRALRQDIAELDNDVKSITSRVPTADQMAELQGMLADRAGRKWFGKRLRFYGWGLLALLGGIYVVRDYLSRLAAWLAVVLR